MAGRILEIENGKPADWEDNVILVRDGKGNVIEIDVPDDEEGGEDHVADNKA